MVLAVPAKIRELLEGFTPTEHEGMKGVWYEDRWFLPFEPKFWSFYLDEGDMDCDINDPDNPFFFTAYICPTAHVNDGVDQAVSFIPWLAFSALDEDMEATFSHPELSGDKDSFIFYLESLGCKYEGNIWDKQ